MKPSCELTAELAVYGWRVVDLETRLETLGAVMWQATIERTDGRRTALVATDEGRLIEECIKHARTYPASSSIRSQEVAS